MQSARESSGFRRFQKSHCNYPCHVCLPSPPLPPPSLLRERGDLPWRSPTLAYQVVVGLGTSPSIVTREGCPIREEGSKGRQQSQRQPLLIEKYLPLSNH